MNKLVESIHIMNKLAREIGFRISLIVDFEFPLQSVETISDKNLTLLNSLFYMAVIDSISFLEEYQVVFGQHTEEKYKGRITIVKAINKPFISKINEWKNLKDLRNHLLAHNLRIGKNGKFIFSEKGLKYNAPRNFNDLFLLYNLISFAAQTINSEFDDELKSTGLINVETIDNNGITLTKEDVSIITIALIKEANKLKQDKDRNYAFSINELINWDQI